MPLVALRVLLVEDSPSEQLLTKARLAKAGWSDVTLCQSIDEAVALAPGHDVAVLDLGLAATTGSDSVVRFRQSLLDMPLVVLTGQAGDEHVASSIRHGADEYLVKGDLTTAQLRRSVLIAIERHRAAQVVEGIGALMERLASTSEAVVVLFQHAHEHVLARCVSQGIDASGFHFVDLTQRDDGGLVAPPGVSFIGSPVQLEKATMRVFQACRTMTSPTVFIDSITTLTLYNGERVAKEFLDLLSRRLSLAGHPFNIVGPPQTI